MSGLINGGFMILDKKIVESIRVIHVHLKTISFQLSRVTSSFLHLSTMAFVQAMDTLGPSLAP